MTGFRRLLLTFSLALSVQSAGLQAQSDSHAVDHPNNVLVEGVRVGRHTDKTRLVFDLSHHVQYQHRQLNNEFVLELAWDSQLVPLGPPRAITGMDLGKTSVREVLVQQQAGGGNRIIIMLSQSARIDSFDLQPYADRSYRFVVDVFHQDIEVAEQAIDAAANAAPKVVAGGGSTPENRRATDSSTAASQSPAPAGEAQLPSSGRIALTPATTVAFSGVWEHEWAVNSVSGESQKFESLIEPEWNVNFANGVKATIVGRIRLDGVGDLGPDAYKSFNYSQASAPLYNTQSASLVLRELYFDVPLANSYLRLGKQQVVWGESDGIKVLDVVNPQSFREFILDDFEDSRIPLWMVNWELPLGDTANLQVLWIPDLTYDELAEVGSPYFVTSPQLVPNFSGVQSVQVLEPVKPDNIWSDADWGLKFSSLLGNWDTSLQYLYQYVDTPAFYSYQSDNSETVVAPRYERTHLLGSTLSNTFRDFTVRAELAYKSDTFQISAASNNDGIENSSEFSSVLGLDWQASSDILLSAQWFYSFLFDYERDIVRDETEQLASLLFQSDFDNATWQFQALSLYSLNNEDLLFQFKLRYWLESNIEIWLGSDVFHGTSRGLFGQFDQQDRVLMGFNYGF